MSEELTAASPSAKEQADWLLQVWEKTVDLQMHFNDMCMSIRRTAIGTLGALLGAGALAFRYGGPVTVYGRTVSVAFVFIAVAVLIWLSFWLMDRFWYHKLLRASVAYAETLETVPAASHLGFELNLSRNIREQNRGTLKLSGAAKIHFFYLLIAAALVAADVMLYVGVVKAGNG